ncbi:MAG: hypothetical protein EP343_31080 [Deltaproteobacteria bacterium]|nr:MAG: hypothetical protein EP343_31080 [Deltaproteobacteria bacterium]
MRKGLYFVLFGLALLFAFSLAPVTGCSGNGGSEATGESSGGEKVVTDSATEAAQEEKSEEKPTTTDDGGEDGGDTKEDGPESAKEDGPEGPAFEPNPNVGKVRWSTSVQGEVKSIAIAPDQTQIYVAARGLSALDATTGNEAWSIGTLGEAISAPVVDSKGMIYVSSKSKLLYAIDPKTKKTAWNAQLLSEGDRFPPALGKDGVILVASGNTLQAFKAPGTSAWSANYVLSGKVNSAPAVGIDGTIYLCSDDKSLHAIKPDGEKLWEKVLGGSEPCNAVSVDADGTIYVGGSNLNAYKADGTVKWSPQSQYGVVSTAIVIHQTYLYFGTFRGKLFKVSKSTGEPANLLWKNGTTISVNDELRYAPTVGAGGLVYIGSVDATNPEIQFVNPTRGKVERSFGGREPFSGHPAIAQDGTLYVGTTGGTIIALWTDSPGLANSPWPRGLRDNQNTSYLK